MDVKVIGCHPMNFRSGREGLKPKAIVIHIIAGSQQSADNWFNNPASGVSAHYSVSKRGEIHQYVDSDDTAFHAGIVTSPRWVGIEYRPNGSFLNPNLYTLGIEHEGKPDDDWTDAMYDASSQLVQKLANIYAIPLDSNHVIRHCDIRSTKTCPGPKADLNRIISQAQALQGQIIPVRRIEVTTIVNANLRKAEPSTQSPILMTIPKGTRLSMAGFVNNGEPVDGNPNWYKDDAGGFLWAGTTNQPNPSG
jgi:N-acetylmuramoyl-L-alanine amidase CwlA